MTAFCNFLKEIVLVNVYVKIYSCVYKIMNFICLSLKYAMCVKEKRTKGETERSNRKRMLTVNDRFNFLNLLNTFFLF